MKTAKVETANAIIPKFEKAEPNAIIPKLGKEDNPLEWRVSILHQF